MPYPKSNKEVQDSAFTMRSGNTTPFKQMGSSPLKQHPKEIEGTTIFGKTIPEIKQGAKNLLLSTPYGRLYKKIKNRVTNSNKNQENQNSQEVIKSPKASKKLMMLDKVEMKRKVTPGLGKDDMQKMAIESMSKTGMRSIKKDLQKVNSVEKLRRSKLSDYQRRTRQ